MTNTYIRAMALELQNKASAKMLRGEIKTRGLWGRAIHATSTDLSTAIEEMKTDRDILATAVKSAVNGGEKVIVIAADLLAGFPGANFAVSLDSKGNPKDWNRQPCYSRLSNVVGYISRLEALPESYRNKVIWTDNETPTLNSEVNFISALKKAEISFDLSKFSAVRRMWREIEHKEMALVGLSLDRDKAIAAAAAAAAAVDVMLTAIADMTATAMAAEAAAAAAIQANGRYGKVEAVAVEAVAVEAVAVEAVAVEAVAVEAAKPVRVRVRK